MLNPTPTLAVEHFGSLVKAHQCPRSQRERMTFQFPLGNLCESISSCPLFPFMLSIFLFPSPPPSPINLQPVPRAGPRPPGHQRQPAKYCPPLPGVGPASDPSIPWIGKGIA